MVNALVNLSKPESKACREMIARYVRVNPTGGGGGGGWGGGGGGGGGFDPPSRCVK